MKWFHFILSHSIFIAFCAAALVFQTVQLQLLHVSFYLYGFVFFATLCSYNFYWLLSKYSFAQNRSVTELIKKETTLIFLLVISSTGLLYCFFKTTLSAEIIAIAILLTIIYSFPLLPFARLQFIHKAGVLKTILLAFTWTYVTAFLPLQKPYWLLDDAQLFLITHRFLFMLVLCIIFDNRDMAVDKLRGLRSLATDLKPASLQIITGCLFVLLFVSGFFFSRFGVTAAASVAFQITNTALLAVYFYSNKKQGYLFYYFFVDGMMLFSALATYIAGI